MRKPNNNNSIDKLIGGAIRKIRIDGRQLSRRGDRWGVTHVTKLTPPKVSHHSSVEENADFSRAHEHEHHQQPATEKNMTDKTSRRVEAITIKIKISNEINNATAAIEELEQNLDGGKLESVCYEYGNGDFSNFTRIEDNRHLRLRHAWRNQTGKFH